MPLYSFVCSVCGAHFEERRSFKDSDGPTICPNGHASVHRHYLAPAVVFKGSGWYSTDHRKADTHKDG